MKINLIGCWAVRIILVLGAVVAAIMGNESVADTLGLIAIASFIFLDPES